jgi:hypothetical protein
MAAANTSLGIDHPLVTVRSHAQLLNMYRKMGFILAPSSLHPWGTVTTHVMFPSNFIELIGVDDASKFGTHADNGFCFGRQLSNFLDRGVEGVSLVALHSKDVDGDHSRLARTGLETQGRMDFRRRMTLPDGRHDEAAVSLGLFIDPEQPEISNFICHQHRPELIWVGSWKNHPNGADGVLSITYLADPALLETRWKKLYGDSVTFEGGVLEADTKCGVLRAIDRAKAAQEFPGIDLPNRNQDRPHAIAIRVSSRKINTLHAILLHNDVPHRDLADRILVEPRAAGNVIREFVQTAKQVSA